ncbi:MAG: flagellar basal-body MS-ring/collar protein FliF [Pedococcus sp.]
MNGFDPRAVLARFSRMFASFTPGQRVVTAVAAVAVVVGSLMFVSWVSKPSYAPVFTGLSSSDAAAITAKLTDSGEPYELADGGQTVMVPQADVYQTRITLSGEGLPAGDSSSQGYSLLDKQSMTSSDFQQKVTYQRALEGELSKTIESIDGVQAAVVHLAVPQDDVFTTDAAKPTGSVLVKTSPGADLSSNMVESIVNLVAGSVPKLDPKQVTVADSSGKVLNAAGQGGGGAAGTDARQSQKLAVANATAAAVQSMLDKVVGPGKAVVRVDADLNFDEQTLDRETYVPTKPNTTLTQTRSKESYTGGGTPVGGVLGPDNAGGTTASGKNDYVKEDSTQTNAVGTLKEKTTTAPGKVQRLSVAVLLDAKAAGSVDQTQLSSLVSAAAGLDPKRGDVVQVSQMAFDTTAAAAAQKELEQAAADKKRADLVSLGKTIGLGVLILLALVIGLIRSRRRGPAATQQIEVYRVPTGPAPVDSLLEQAEQRQGLPHRESAGEQRVKSRESIGALARERPDDVARLLRGWIAEGS